MSDLDTFRDETRAWLEAECPPEMRQPVLSSLLPHQPGMACGAISRW